MKCDDVKSQLTDLLQGVLSDDRAATLRTHLSECASCRRERDALQEILNLLSATRAPETPVDLDRLYREAAVRDKRRLRRWRRVAAVMTGVAALLLFAFLSARLQVRWQDHQLIVRWGQPPSAPTVDPPINTKSIVARPSVEEMREQRERLQTLTTLVHALSEDKQLQDFERQRELARLQRQLEALEQESARWRTEMEHSFAGLYQLHLVSRKGDQP